MKNLILLIIFFFPLLMSAQNVSDKSIMKNTDYKKGIRVNLKIDENIMLKDSLSIKLISFSHKADLNGHVMMGIAHIILSKDSISEEKIISVLTDEAKPLVEQNEYDTLFWKEYEIRLVDLVYDKSIELLVLKKIINK